MDGQNRQRLTSEEETAMVNWVECLQAWGWPARIEQVRCMAIEILKAKEDNEPLGINWPQKFLSRHPDLRTMFISPLDKERAEAQRYEILSHWFQLFL